MIKVQQEIWLSNPNISAMYKLQEENLKINLINLYNPIQVEVEYNLNKEIVILHLRLLLYLAININKENAKNNL